MGPGRARPDLRFFAKGGKLEPLAAEIEDEIWDVLPAADAADETLVRLVAFQAARVQRAHEHLDRVGLVDSRGQPQPILSVLSIWENSLSRNLDRLALSPTARANLGLQSARGRCEAFAGNPKNQTPAEQAELRRLVAKYEGRDE